LPRGSLSDTGRYCVELNSLHAFLLFLAAAIFFVRRSPLVGGLSSLVAWMALGLSGAAIALQPKPANYVLRLQQDWFRTELVALATSKGTRVAHEIRGEHLDWDGAQMDFLWPQIVADEVAPSAKNDDSLVFRVRYGE
jgi:hypothetical protein